MPLHPEVEGMVSGLDDTPLAWIAASVRGFIADSDLSRNLSGEGSLSPFEQLALADKVLRGVLERELALVTALRESAAAFGVKDVAISPWEAEGRRADGEPDLLFRPERGQSIEKLLAIWADARQQVAVRLESGGRGI